MGRRSMALAVVTLVLCSTSAHVGRTQEASPSHPDRIEWPAPLTAPGPITLSVRPFGDGLVATGQWQSGRTTRAAAWWSVDGVAWEQTFRQGPKRGYTSIQHVVATPDGLVGMGPAGVERCTGEGEGGVRCDPLAIAIWRSADGHAWERLALHGSVGRGSANGLAAGPLGVLAVGADERDLATTWRSLDGLAWTAASLTGDGFDRALLLDVVAHGDTWVMVGATGGREVPPGGVGTPNGSSGAAWTSVDGVTWQPATVDGIGDQVELQSVFSGIDGLVAVGTLTGGDTAAIWTSTDGTDWRILPPTEDGASLRLPVAADGTVIIAMSRGVDGSLDWWISSDGASWSPLVSVGSVDTAPRWDGEPTVEAVDLVDDTLIVLGRSDAGGLVWLAPLGPVGLAPST